MPEAHSWCLIFSDGTGQRGVRDREIVSQGGRHIRNTNVFQMYAAADGQDGFTAFYDPGLGAPEEGAWGWTRAARNLWSKATGWGISANIADCYEALMLGWQPGTKIGVFGFSRGAYTVRCLGGVLATCGIARSDGGAPIPQDRAGPGAARRREIAEEAVAAYKIKDETERRVAGRAFAVRYASELVVPDVVGVFDTVRSLGLPGVMNVANPWRHEFHDTELNVRVSVGLHALSVDENRKAFLPVLWDDVDAAGRGAGQVIEQVWFPGVHSDIGGGYTDDSRLADLALAWMLERLGDLADLHIPLTVEGMDLVLGKAHDERTGFGVFWLPAERTIRAETIDIDPLSPRIETRFRGYRPPYRPVPLTFHPRVQRFY
jgi:uncharacterized protein (DUF2235 family)